MSPESLASPLGRYGQCCSWSERSQAGGFDAPNSGNSEKGKPPWNPKRKKLTPCYERGMGERSTSVVFDTRCSIPSSGPSTSMPRETGHFAEVPAFIQDISQDESLSAHTRSRLKESLALARIELGSPDDAEQLLRDAIEIDPTNASAISNLGVVLAEEGHLKEAARHFRTCLGLDTRHWTWEVHANLADVLLQLGALREAEDHCRQALELKPDCKETLEVLQQIATQSADLSANDEKPPSLSRPVSKRRARRKRSKKRGKKRHR